MIYAEVSGDHGARTVGEHPRIYYIIDGEGEFIIGKEKTNVKAGDVLTIPPLETYTYKATKAPLKLILFMELIDLNKLPKTKS